MKSGIYKIECVKTNKIYIGQTINLDRRIYEHKRNLNQGKHHNKYLQRAFDKYGGDCFSISIIERCPIEDLDNKERFWIDHYDSMNPKKGFNMESGGNEGKIVSDETRQKKVGSNNPMYGKTLTKEHIEALRKANRGYHSQLTEDIVAEIKRAFVNGEKTSDVAERYGITKATASKIRSCDNWGYVCEELNEILKTQTKRQKDERNSKIKSLYREGWSRAKISEEVGCTPSTVARVLGKRSEYFLDSEKKMELKSRIANDYKQGLSAEEIMDKYNVRRSFYTKCISDTFNENRNSEIRKAIEMRRSGMMVKDIAEELGRARTTISRWTKDV